MINPLTRHAAGARQLRISVHFDDKLRFIRDRSEQLMPAFR